MARIGLSLLFALALLVAQARADTSLPAIQSDNASLVLSVGLDASVILSSLTNASGVVSPTTDTLVGLNAITALISSAVAPIKADLDTERSRAIAAEGALNFTLSVFASQLTLAESSRALSVEAGLVAMLLLEQSRAIVAEAAEVSQAILLSSLEQSLAFNLDAKTFAELSRATVTEGSLSVSINNEVFRATNAEASIYITQSNAINQAQSRAIGAESSLSRALAQSASVATVSIQLETSRASAAEGSLAAGLGLSISRAVAAEASLGTAFSIGLAADVSAIRAETSRASSAEGSLAGALSGSVVAIAAAQSTMFTSLSSALGATQSQAIAVQSSLANSANIITTSLSNAIISETSRAVVAEASLARVVNNISSSKYQSQTFLCTPSTGWGSGLMVTGSNVGCSVTFNTYQPTMVIAMMNAHCLVVSGWLYTGISINNDFPLTVDASTVPMAQGAGYSPSHTYNTQWELTRTARARYIPANTAVTVQVRWLASAANAQCNGYSMKVLAIAEQTLPTLPNVNFFVPAAQFGCTFTAWSFPLTLSMTNYILCNATFKNSVPSIAWSFFGGHETQTAGSAYGFISYDNDAVAPLADYSLVNSAYSAYLGATSWEGFNSARVKIVPPGNHQASPSFYTLAATTGAAFNGGGLQGFVLPVEPMAGANQIFRCSANSQVAIGTTATVVCTATINLPYRAAVWAEFSSSARVSSGWLYASVDFDGDTVALLNAATTGQALCNLGPAHTYATVFKNFGHGRVSILSPGVHTVSVYGRASVSAVIQGAGLDGFYVYN